MVFVISSEQAWKVHHNQPEKISHANGDIATSELLTLVNVKPCGTTLWTGKYGRTRIFACHGSVNLSFPIIFAPVR